MRFSAATPGAGRRRARWRIGCGSAGIRPRPGRWRASSAGPLRPSRCAVSRRRFARSRARCSSMQAGSWSATRRDIRACWSWTRAWRHVFLAAAQLVRPVFLAVVVNPFQARRISISRSSSAPAASPRNFCNAAASVCKTSIDVTRADRLMASGYLCCRYSSMISAFRSR